MVCYSARFRLHRDLGELRARVDQPPQSGSTTSTPDCSVRPSVARTEHPLAVT